MAKGAGILLLENYKNNPVITLFGRDGLNFSDVGGKIDPGETPEEAAYREGREETANLINISPDELNFYAGRVEFNGYVAYIMYIDQISYYDYAHNLNIIFNNCSSKQNHWKETNSMTRIPLNNIVLAAQNNFDYAADINGKTVPIRGRTMGIIRTGMNVLVSMINLMKPIKLYKHLVTSSRLACLIGTYTCTITEQSIYAKSPSKFGKSKYGSKNTSYGIYIAPDLNNNSHPFLINCNPTWGGMHVTIAGFHPENINAKKFIKYLSSQGSTHWTVSIDKIKVKDNTIYFASRTLDKIANFLHDNDFNRVKGKKNAGVEWHISSDCPVPKNIKNILNNQTWSLVVIKQKNNSVKWLDRYPLHIL